MLQGENFFRDGAEHRRRASTLVEGIDAKTCDPGDGEGKIGFKLLFIFLALPVIHDVVNEIMGLLGIHGRQIDPPDIAIDPDHGWQARRKMQVGSPIFDGKRQQLRDIHGDPDIPRD